MCASHLLGNSCACMSRHKVGLPQVLKLYNGCCFCFLRVWFFGGGGGGDGGLGFGFGFLERGDREDGKNSGT